MPATLTINGVDRTAKVPFKSYQLTDNLLARGDVLSFTMPVAADQISIRPLVGEPVVFSVDGTTMFSGNIAALDESRMINADYFDYQITCQDSTHRLDRRLVVLEDVGPDNADNIVRTVLRQFAPEFATDFSQIHTNLLVVSEQQFDYVPVSNVLDQLSGQANAIWYVDASRRVVFTSNLDQLAPIESYDVDANLQLGDFTWSDSVDQIKNRIYIKDTKIKDENSRTDKWTAVGSDTSFFKLSYEPFDEDGTSVRTTSKKGVKRTWTVALDSNESDDATLLGTTGTAYVCLINWGIRFPLNDLPKDGDLVEATYDPVRGDDGELVFMVEDRNSQSMMAEREGGASDGIYEHVVSMPDVRVASPDPIEAYGNLLLERIAWPQVRGTFKTQEVKGWKAGQSFTLTSSKRDIFDLRTYWRSGNVTKDPIRVWIQSVQTTLLGEDIAAGSEVLLHTIEFSNQPFGRV